MFRVYVCVCVRGRAVPEPEGDGVDLQKNGVRPVVEALLAANVTVYTSCDSLEQCDLPPGVRTLGRLKPEE